MPFFIRTGIWKAYFGPYFHPGISSGQPKCPPGIEDFYSWTPRNNLYRHPGKLFLYWGYGIQTVRFSTPWNSGGGGKEKQYPDFRRLQFPWKMDVTYPGKLYSSCTPWIISVYFHLYLGLFKMTAVVDNHEQCLTTLENDWNWNITH